MLRREHTRRIRWTLIAALAALAATLVLITVSALGERVLPQRTGPPVEELSVERTVLSPGRIELTVRNAGPDPVTIAQVAVNDSFVAARGAKEPLARLGVARLELDYPWLNGQPYVIGMLTSTGLVIEHEIPVATATPGFGPALALRMAVLGVLIGVLPVFSGIAFWPMLRRAGAPLRRWLMALTVGLLGFLAVDAVVDGIALGDGAEVFGGTALLALSAAMSLMALAALDHVLGRRSDPRRLALLIAVGIGLHNLGEGLAVGSAYAVGALALGTTLVVGFAMHNLTEGVAIVTPLTGSRLTPPTALGLGIVAGAPAALGTVLGASVTTPAAALVLLGLGIGAVVRVVAVLWPLLGTGRGRVGPVELSGMAVGAAAMYLTGLLVAV
jgi:ZIP family zinc transporter